MNIRPIRITAALAITAVVSAVVVACGSSETAVVAPQDTVDSVALAADTTGSTEPAESQETRVSAADAAAKTDETQATVL